LLKEKQKLTTNIEELTDLSKKYPRNEGYRNELETNNARLEQVKAALAEVEAKIKAGPKKVESKPVKKAKEYFNKWREKAKAGNSDRNEYLEVTNKLKKINDEIKRSKRKASTRQPTSLRRRCGLRIG